MTKLEAVRLKERGQKTVLTVYVTTATKKRLARLLFRMCWEQERRLSQATLVEEALVAYLDAADRK